MTSCLQRGYIAITAAFFLALLITTVAVSLGLGSYFGRISGQDLKFKKEGFFLARTCLDNALLKLALDSNYLGSETVIIDEIRQCTVRPVLSSPPNKIIEARAQVSGATTNLKLTVNSSTLATVSLEELAIF